MVVNRDAAETGRKGCSRVGMGGRVGAGNRGAFDQQNSAGVDMFVRARYYYILRVFFALRVLCAVTDSQFNRVTQIPSK